MRSVTALVCGALLSFSMPAFAQSTTTSSSTVSTSTVAQPNGTSVVNYENGLEALGQAPPDQSILPTGTGSNGLLIGLGVVGVAGLTIGLIASNNNNGSSVSP